MCAGVLPTEKVRPPVAPPDKHLGKSVAEIYRGVVDLARLVRARVDSFELIRSRLVDEMNSLRSRNMILERQKWGWGPRAPDVTSAGPPPFRMQPVARSPTRLPLESPR